MIESERDDKIEYANEFDGLLDNKCKRKKKVRFFVNKSALEEGRVYTMQKRYA